MAAPVLAYSRDLQDADVLFATGWQTAYPVFNQRTSARKFYLVQDFEPSFYAVGTESVLAENTYRFNLHGIAAGRWLSDRLSKGYGMRCDYFDFGSDPFVYVNQGIPNRRGVVFYARPVTPRRGFELGVLALELFHRAHPDVGIHMVGWDVADYKIPFPFTNHGIVPPRQLNAVYNQCAVGLVLSFTNLSLLPLELLSSGCIPVVNDAPSNRLVTDSQLIRYAPPNPQALADALGHVVSDPDLDAHAREGSRSVASLSWDDAGSKIENILLRELRE